MTPPNQSLSLPFGKRHWHISELKEILDIQLLNLRCHAPIQSRSEDGKECDNSISIWYSLRVRSLLQQLSKSPSDLPPFADMLKKLAYLMCCKLHQQSSHFEIQVFDNWRVDLYGAGERELRYLQERKALQYALRSPSRSRVQSVSAEDDAILEPRAEEVVVAPIMPLPKSRSVMTLSRNPRLIRNGPRPIIHFIRHAEAGNGQENDFYTRDPDLTEHGKQECARLSQIFNRHDFVTHLIVSPLTRCVSTALNAFGPTIQNGIKVTLVPEIQAAGSCLSCIGLPPSQLKEKYSVEEYGNIFEFDWVGNGWTKKLEGTYACDEQSVYKRVKDIFRWCRDGQDGEDGENGRREIVIVTHASILTHFGHDWEAEVPTTSWVTFTFDEDWKIYEVPDSKRRRHAPNPQISEPYSPASSTSSGGKTPPPSSSSSSRIPVAQFSTVKFRPNMIRDNENDSNEPTCRYGSYRSRTKGEAYRPRTVGEIQENSILPDGAIVSDEEEQWF